MCENVTWNDLDAQARHSPDELGTAEVPAGPSVYAWYRDGRAVYVGGARSLNRRLLEADIGGGQASTARFRPRLRGYLAQSTGRCPPDVDETEIDEWIGGCQVAWVACHPIRAAVAKSQGLARERWPLLNRWYPRAGEDGWLLTYLNGLGGPEHAGRCYVEVPVGGPRYGEGSGLRRIDAVLIPGLVPGNVRDYDDKSFRADIEGQDLEVIEVKKDLNRPVIGQLVVARDLISFEWEDIERLSFTAVCKEPDPALEGVCRRLGIHVAYVDRQACEDID